MMSGSRFSRFSKREKSSFWYTPTGFGVYDLGRIVDVIIDLDAVFFLELLNDIEIDVVGPVINVDDVVVATPGHTVAAPGKRQQDACGHYGCYYFSHYPDLTIHRGR
jgi:hypothetical protein